MLEDEFVDVFRKARRGRKVDETELAERTGLPADAIRRWATAQSVPSASEARALATALGIDPDAFADSAAVAWHPDVAVPPGVETYSQLVAGTSDYYSNGYVATDDASGQVAVIDPAGDPTTILRVLERGTGDVRYILITHEHADHSDAAAALAERYPEATIVIHELDAPGIGALARRATTFSRDTEFPFGGGAIGAIHTPGHTDGSTSFTIGPNVYTGDLLFAGSVGGSVGTRYAYDDVLASVRSGILTLDDATVILPGHGPPTTVALEKRHNPFVAT